MLMIHDWFKCIWLPDLSQSSHFPQQPLFKWNGFLTWKPSTPTIEIHLFHLSMSPYWWFMADSYGFDELDLYTHPMINQDLLGIAPQAATYSWNGLGTTWMNTKHPIHWDPSIPIIYDSILMIYEWFMWIWWPGSSPPSNFLPRLLFKGYGHLTGKLSIPTIKSIRTIHQWVILIGNYWITWIWWPGSSP